MIMDKPKSKHGERFVKVKAIIKTWTEVESIIEYDTHYEQFIIPNGFQCDCKILKWNYV